MNLAELLNTAPAPAPAIDAELKMLEQSIADAKTRVVSEVQSIEKAEAEYAKLKA